MRKYHVKQVLAVLDSLNEAQDAELYGDCQDTALALCDFIDDSAGVGTETVSLLESYCEILFKVSSGELDKNTLKKYLTKVDTCAKYELRATRVEIVFLSYQAQRFDTFRSIYDIAKKDPNCDVFVVPIPHYERNLRDGSFGKMIYEIHDYPKDIPITYFEDYDIEVRNPDVIFTHYPYEDEINASVGPEHFHKRLREFCELLVHVPYFMYSIVSIPDFLPTLPGMLYSHKVVLRSEEYRQVFLKHFDDFEKKYGVNGRFGKAEDKFVVLGSPKFDKILLCKPEDFDLPAAWRKMIERPGKPNRKTILLNTHIFQSTIRGKYFLEKMRHIFDVFRKNDDVVLWWRPHPVLEMNLRTRRPYLLDEYLSIVDEYKKSGLGIFDNTADLDRAIIYTDAYYGDSSSLVAMYLPTGKPIMMQNINVTNDSKFSVQWLNIIGNDIYFSLSNINGLFKMDKDAFSAEFLGYFPNEQKYMQTSSLYSVLNLCNIVNLKDIIYFFSDKESTVATYNVANSIFEEINFKQIEKVDDRSSLKSRLYYATYNIFHREGCLFLTSVGFPSIARLDLNTNEFLRLDNWVEDYLEKIGGKDLIFGKSTIVEDVIYLPSANSNTVLEFNINTFNYAIHTVGEKHLMFSGICYDGENFWISPRAYTTIPLVKWTPQKGILREFSEIYKSGRSYAFHPAILCDGHVWLLPHMSHNAYKIDIKTDELYISHEFTHISEDSVKDYTEVKEYVTSPQIDGDTIIAYNEFEDAIVSYNCRTKKRETKSIKFSKETIKTLQTLKGTLPTVDTKLKEQVFDFIYREDNYFNLENFAKYIAYSTDLPEEIERKKQQEKMARDEYLIGDKSSGEVIYSYVKNILEIQ